MSGSPRRGGWRESAQCAFRGSADVATDRQVSVVVAVLTIGPGKAAVHDLGMPGVECNNAPSGCISRI